MQAEKMKPDVDTSELEDIAIVCEIRVARVMGTYVSKGKACTEPVKWVGNRPCCGKIVLICDDHVKARYPWFCLACQVSHHAPTNWRLL